MQLAKHKKLVLIAPHEATHAHHVADRFLKFCKKHGYRYAIGHEVDAASFKKDFRNLIYPKQF